KDSIRFFHVTGVQTCALPISLRLHLGRWRYHPARACAPQARLEAVSPQRDRGGAERLFQGITRRFDVPVLFFENKWRTWVRRCEDRKSVVKGNRFDCSSVKIF